MPRRDPKQDCGSRGSFSVLGVDIIHLFTHFKSVSPSPLRPAAPAGRWPRAPRCPAHTGAEAGRTAPGCTSRRGTCWEGRSPPFLGCGNRTQWAGPFRSHRAASPSVRPDFLLPGASRKWNPAPSVLSNSTSGEHQSRCLGSHPRWALSVSASVSRLRDPDGTCLPGSRRNNNISEIHSTMLDTRSSPADSSRHCS